MPFNHPEVFNWFRTNCELNSEIEMRLIRSNKKIKYILVKTLLFYSAKVRNFAVFAKSRKKIDWAEILREEVYFYQI